eukprot:TRINITY_DN745_c0_g1_i9.p1 TRINITY_DN745_c0_g1~~TRINITY_DN745_c0_g1_i9.p1  ORF type:complete len:272 (+),score=32.60 TRINITY_DN745_c0_g1_i9:1972-2787(+)
MTRHLLEKGADPISKKIPKPPFYSCYLDPPLLLAVKETQNLLLVKMLLQAAANHDVSRTNSVCFLAEIRNHALQVAVDHYCKHPETGTDNRTADLTIVKLLLESGATVGFNGPNICPYEYRPNESALSQAIKMRSLELLKLLLRNGGKQALRAKFTAHPVSKIRCPIYHDACEIMTTIGAEENGLFLTFECKNNELAAALTACMRPRAALEDYYCYYYESDYGDYYLDFGEEKEDVRRAKGSKKSLYRTKRPHFKDRKPRRAHPDDYSLSG